VLPEIFFADDHRRQDATIFQLYGNYITKIIQLLTFFATLDKMQDYFMTL